MKTLTAFLILAFCLSAQTWSHQRYAHKPTPAPTPAPIPAGSVSTSDQIAADMVGLNEGHPHGVPLSWDFANGPFIENGNNPKGATAAVLWGAIYVNATGSTSTNTRINIRSCQLWELTTAKTWVRGDANQTPDVGYYAEDFSADYGPADVRNEPDGTISTVTTIGRTAHFYAPYPRFGFDPSRLVGWVSLCEMRLILANSINADDRSNAHFLASVGGDYYPAPTGPGIENNPGIAGGKFKIIQNNWRSFAMTTLSKAQIEATPPPISLAGILP